MSTNEKKEYFSSSGSKLYYPLKYKYDEECKCEIPYFDKPLDRFKMIQASKNSTDISAILERAKCGDVSVLHVHPDETYMDVSEVPDNLNDFNAQRLNAMGEFYKLDPKIRAIFDNDVNNFVESINDNSYADKIKNALIVKEEKVDESGDK